MRIVGICAGAQVCIVGICAYTVRVLCCVVWCTAAQRVAGAAWCSGCCAAHGALRRACAGAAVCCVCLCCAPRRAGAVWCSGCCICVYAYTAQRRHKKRHAAIYGVPFVLRGAAWCVTYQAPVTQLALRVQYLHCFATCVCFAAKRAAPVRAAQVLNLHPQLMVQVAA